MCVCEYFHGLDRVTETAIYSCNIGFLFVAYLTNMTYGNDYKNSEVYDKYPLNIVVSVWCGANLIQYN